MTPCLTFTPLLKVVSVRTLSQLVVEVIRWNMLAFSRVFTSVMEGQLNSRRGYGAGRQKHIETGSRLVTVRG